ncbi:MULTISPECIES: zinc-binding dehydrogenase [Mycolicibacterium]|uniref:alcohol dehydrogenase n=1 Tax=Mycolicibacterium senegalense TaxID=1796 RepID=A0A378W5A5_9MYCO|nr:MULTISPECIES: zinc-binding dehydrogenase [Mycolicibacterium]MCV7333674.1 zinc-binding dehydrogenase [Mycolicibacterium senegalense]MDR7288146.1 putative phosphonate catabolism associated alcohol dehydrogenase [Mycolicibacterium senegalense]QZA25123.1 zinc-binding dehydrogenase [Mycolicibacterium senegalense]CDP86025.1 alcohol dehydrogenase [Mycolicibacterium farcinogenes]SUA28277.1 alcohol dehydrogenase [Mycolicibacterium senegalense]
MDPISPRVTAAAVWTGSGVDMRTVPVPELGDGEVLVRVRLATVCGSDLHTVMGRRPAPCPSVLGHEAVGDVVAVGPGADAQVGQRVIWSVTVVCGSCSRCRSGLSAKCLSVRKVGHEPFDGDWPLSGSYAAHVVLPRGTTIVAVPGTLPDAVAAPAACATATVMATLEAAGDLKARRVLINGAGMLGLTAVAACASAGAEVQVIDRNPDRMALAARFGGLVSDHGPVDVAIDYTGSTVAVSEALGRLDIGGTLVLAGSVTPGPPLSVDPETVVRHWLTITGVHNYEPRHLHQAVEFLDRTRERYPWESLVVAPVPLEDIEEALRTPPSGKLRTAVTP